METTEKIVEAYVRYVKGWATIPNIRCAGQHEIDLIAIDPVSLERYHIETSVSISQSFSRLTSKAFDPEAYKKPVAKASQRRTLGFFIERKFGPAPVKEALAAYGFGEDGGRKVIVTWDWTPEALAIAGAHSIELWSFQDLMLETAEMIRHRRSYFGDDTLRTINLFVRATAGERVAPVSQASSPSAGKKASDAIAKASTAPWWVYRNRIQRRARLHASSCPYCNDGAGTQGAVGNVSGDWNPFSSIDEARSFLKQSGYADASACAMCGGGG